MRVDASCQWRSSLVGHHHPYPTTKQLRGGVQSRLEQVLNLVLVSAALMALGLLVRREFVPARQAQAGPLGPEFVEDWREILPASRTLGDTSAPIRLIEFVDMQCPYCARFHAVLTRVMAKQQGTLSYSFVHFPLKNHPHALVAARAVECARSQRAFNSFLNVTFAHQDSIGKKGWPWFASRAGVADTGRFGRCVRDTMPLPIVASGVEMATRFGVRGTPTILLNGWMYRSALSEQQLERAVQRLQNGREPK